MSHVSVRQHPTPRCLPHELRRLGYGSVAMHAYNAGLFERAQWYPRVGFQELRFAENLSGGRSLPGCGVMFHGPCDTAVIPTLREVLARTPGEREFIYWLSSARIFPSTRGLRGTRWPARHWARRGRMTKHARSGRRCGPCSRGSPASPRIPRSRPRGTSWWETTGRRGSSSARGADHGSTAPGSPPIGGPFSPTSSPSWSCGHGCLG